jgi:hypothetical protein
MVALRIPSLLQLVALVVNVLQLVPRRSLPGLPSVTTGDLDPVMVLHLILLLQPLVVDVVMTLLFAILPLLVAL